jgi:hypothetical protein
MDLVRQFQGDHGIDPTRPEAGGEVAPFRNAREGRVDARTWEALGAPVRYDRRTAATGR